MRGCARTSAWWPSRSVNARALSADDLREQDGDKEAEEHGESRISEPFDLVVGDLSFISLTLVLPALVRFLADDGQLLMLVKPQFELQPGQVGKGGIVRDESMYAVVEKRLRDACAALGCGAALVRQPDRRGRRQPRVLHSRRARCTATVPKETQVRLPLSLNSSRPRRPKARQAARRAPAAVRAQARVLLGHLRRGRLHAPGTFAAVQRDPGRGRGCGATSRASAPRAPRCASSWPNSRPWA
jgi:hypothetical protein